MDSDTKVKENAIKRQVKALNCDLYRVTLMRNKIGQNFSNSGRKESNPEKFYNLAEIIAAINALKKSNSIGWNVYFTPISDDFHFILVDDLDSLYAIDNLKNEGYLPCLVQKTSKDSYQGVLKIPKLFGKNEQSFANNLLRDINTKFGDKKITGVVHPIRLGGFSNKKPNRNNEFTKLIETNDGAICTKGESELQEIRIKGKSVNHFEAKSIKLPVTILPTSSVSITAFNEYSRLRRSYEIACQKLNWVKDESLIDFKVAKEMMKAGFSESDIAYSILSLSPDLVNRHPNSEKYAITVAKNAFKY